MQGRGCEFESHLVHMAEFTLDSYPELREGKVTVNKYDIVSFRLYKNGVLKQFDYQIYPDHMEIIDNLGITDSLTLFTREFGVDYHWIRMFFATAIGYLPNRAMDENYQFRKNDMLPVVQHGDYKALTKIVVAIMEMCIKTLVLNNIRTPLSPLTWNYYKTFIMGEQAERPSVVEELTQLKTLRMGEGIMAQIPNHTRYRYEGTSNNLKDRNGKIVKIDRSSAEISRGEVPRGVVIQGRTSEVAVTVGQVSHQEILG